MLNQRLELIKETLNKLFSKYHKECEEHELNHKVELLKKYHLNNL